MKTPRAVICDVYKTLLEVGPPPEEAGRRWRELLSKMLPAAESLSLGELSESCVEIVKTDHEKARAAGILYPEVHWPSVMARAVPDFAALNGREAEEFVFHHMQLLRSLRIAPGAVEYLAECRRRRIPLGIVSNAQAYTLRELETAGLSMAGFVPDLVFWSFKNGFSKPDPHVFRMVSAALALRGIDCSEVLVVGDREDNDIRPAAAQGFQTWHFAQTPEADWAALHRCCFA